jgi:hypothetical protein
LAVDSVLAEMVSGIGPIELHSCGVGFSSEFTRTLFVKFQPCPVLAAISRALQMRGVEPYDLEPHLSLVYAHLSQEAKQVFAAEMHVPSKVRFNSVRAVATNSTVSKADVLGWRTIAERSLHCA